MAGTKRGALSLLRGGAPGISELYSVVRELSFDELRDEAQTPPRLLLLGADHGLLQALRDALAAGATGSYFDTAGFADLPQHLDVYDAIVLVNASPADRNLPGVRQLFTNAETAGRTLTFQVPPSVGRNDRPDLPAEAVADLRRRLLTRLAHRQLALGRFLPSFRQDAALSTINTTARANAEFALLSNIPAVIPLVGNLMAVGADFLVLTKNQLMLIYKLAAIHGCDLQQPWRIYTEMLPVVGAGIFWRTVARELASLIPLAGGAIPKLIVAYAGTMVAGQAAHFYYDKGTRPSGEQMKGFYARAAARARDLGILNRDARTVIEGHFTERPPIPAEPATTERTDVPAKVPPAGNGPADEATAPPRPPADR